MLFIKKKKKLPEKKVRVIAHRGFSSVAPENTLASFQEAINIGADMIEFDIQLSKDGEIVVIHDKKLNRTTNGKGDVSKFTLMELKTLDAGLWFSDNFKDEKIPTLEEVIELAKGKIKLNIEIKKYAVKRLEKENRIEDKLVKIIEKYDLQDDVLISSFSDLAIKRIKALNPNIPTAFLYRFGIGKSLVKKFLKFEICAFNQSKRSFSKRSKNYINKNGLQLNVYTVNAEKEMEKLLKQGVDGIITNYPDKLIEIINKK